MRPVSNGPLATHVPVAALKISADDKRLEFVVPPVLKTVPFPSVVSVSKYRGVIIEPVGVHVFVFALKRSAFGEGKLPNEQLPPSAPATRTCPPAWARKLSAKPSHEPPCADDMLPTVVHVPAAGSKTSALAR